ncbi:MAG TPA: cytochrome ubiquinol oxidase subunit I [Terriglobia bacterium]|jgi:cytochrome bd-type quinol oxidase subunit 1|nr:cytochrome ubiquinol oxidase subunit I [Terriglobia bacterium]
MNYPVWEPFMLGGGMVIGIIAILHIFVSHFAVGGGLFLPMTERKAYRESNPALLEYVKSHSKFFVLVVLVFGAVSGVGIWWSIGLVNPEATATLIHVFVWGWAIEWVFFIVEIAAAFIYYYGWDRLDARTHLAVGWIYFGAAWLSLFIINGILTFMLTPGRWLENQSFASAFFNPGMLPSCIVRTAVSVALAGVYALVTATTIREMDLRTEVTRYAAKWLLAGALVIPLAGIWYISILPPMARETSMGAAPPVTIFAALSIFFSLLVVAFTFFGPYQHPRYFNLTFALLLAVLALSTTAVTEWVREAVRKPYIIYNYMYANTLRLGEIKRVEQQGVLKSALWVREHEVDPQALVRTGEDVFRVECASCHTVNGYNSIRFAVKGWSEAMIDYQLLHLNELKGFMPPFVGTEEERKALAAWLASLNPPSGMMLTEPPAPGHHAESNREGATRP